MKVGFNMTDNKIFKIIKVSDDNLKIVINAGENKGIKIGMKFIVYAKGEELFDPDTNESLGRLEITKGMGKVTHVQEKISTLESANIKTIAPKKTIKRPNPNSLMYPNSLMFSYNQLYEEVSYGEGKTITNPFNDPCVGDFVKYIPE